MTDSIADTLNWGIGTGVSIGVAGMAMKGMKNLYSTGRRRPRAYRHRVRRRR